MVWFYTLKSKNEIKFIFIYYTLPLLLGLMIDWKIDNSYGLIGVWHTYTNLYLYSQYMQNYMLQNSMQ